MVQTFTEYVGELPEFEGYDDKHAFVYSRQDDYNSDFPPDDDTIKRICDFMDEEHLEAHDWKERAGLNRKQGVVYDRADRFLNNAVAMGWLDLRHFRGKVLDFGCGSGGSSIFLANQGSDVTAVDRQKNRIGELRGSGLFPLEKALCTNGYNHMIDQEPATYDLITAFGLGHLDCGEWFIEHFYREARRAVKPDGAIFIESDMLTMDKVRKMFGIECPPFWADIMIYRPQKPSGHQ